MRKLFLFVNNNESPEWLYCLSLTDDGYILGHHICSHIRFMEHDLHDRPDRLKKIKEHYKDEEYEIIILDYFACRSVPEFIAALELANNRDQEIEKAGATITYE